MVSRAAMINWDAEFKRPIIDGKTIHPFTGEVVKAGRKGLIDGPPGVQIHLLNMNADVKLRSTHQVVPIPMEKVYLAVAKHVRDGLYRLVSINASQYSFVIVCDIQVSAEKFDEVWSNKFAKESEADESFGPYINWRTEAEYWDASQYKPAKEPDADGSLGQETTEQAEEGTRTQSL